MSNEARLATLTEENRLLLDEIRVSRQAAEITAKLVVQQFEKSEATLARLDQAKAVAEAALRENKGIFENAPFGICFTYDRKIIRYNRAFGDMFGFSGETGIGRPARVLFPSDEDYAEVGRRAGPLLSNNQPFEHELLLQRQNGESFWGNLKAYISDPQNPSIGTVWLVQDRTAFKAVEAEIERSAEEMTAIFESTTHGIAFIKNRTLVKANSRFEELLGYTQGELVGQQTRLWYADEETYQSVGKAYRDLDQGLTHRCVVQFRRKDGSLFWVRLNGCALSTDPQKGSVWTVEDITIEYAATAAMQQAKEQAEAAEVKLRDSYTELEEANQRLQKLDQLKSDFLSSVSHELRTPLTSIRGFASLVEREFSRSFASLVGEDIALTKKSNRIRDNLSIILKESERLTRLINDVLDLAKIEAGRTEWHDTRIEPENLIRDAANAIHGMFDLKPAVALRLDIQSDLPACTGDADKLLQVLVNLLNNAVKFTERGAVTIKALRNAENLLQIEIHDTGIGFPPADAETIFDKFQQSNHGDTLADRPKGTGLGLAICREIINRHGGRVWAQSHPDKGSVFAFTLPLATQAGLASTVPPAPTFILAAPATPDIAGLAEDKEGTSKVLVVDDDPGVRDYLTQLLRESGYHVIAAADGQAALTAAKAHHPDLITMDLAMPVMDGYSAIVNLRADRELQHIPIIVISAVPGWETAGGDLAMGKPIDEQRFLGNTRLLLGRATGATSRTVRFLMLHENNQTPAPAPASFIAQCEMENCPLDALPARLQAGFRGMVVIPNSLLGKVDLGLLQATPHLEIMIMPQQILPASKTPGQED